MLISDARRMLFVHVPKTGGMSIEDVFKQGCPDARKKRPEQESIGRHITYGQILEREPQAVDYWSFGFVRNPWARMVSWWSMIDKWNHAYGPASGKPQVRVGKMRDGNEMWRTVAAYEGGFDEFVMRGVHELPRIGIPQITYLRAPDHGREVDFVGRTEQLAADLAVVQRRLGLPVDEVPHHNQSGHGSYRDFYTPTTRDKVAEVYAEDISLFGYEF